jgi:hypothetical protein
MSFKKNPHSEHDAARRLFCYCGLATSSDGRSISWLHVLSPGKRKESTFRARYELNASVSCIGRVVLAFNKVKGRFHDETG